MVQHPPIRVLVVDDHTVVRRGLGAFLDAFDDLVLAGDASGGEEGVRRCGEVEPDVVLMDMVMPGLDGAAATRAIRERWPAVQVIALTSFPEEGLVRAALDAGAIGYLLKNASADELAGAIRAAVDGRPTLAPEATRALIRAATRPLDERPPGHDLTAQERKVLALMVEGLSNPEIADRLVISRSTAKFHVSSVLSKLGVGGRSAAVALAVQNHLVG
ncbi:MAG TPA: response regulator transcription factor [Chloroflexota bacterium]|nr:response regulator transcription factor [Chloroflexota bacterium]